MTLTKHVSRDNSATSNIISKSVNKEEISNKGINVNKGNKFLYKILIIL
jgi:hypothetical protein